MNPHISKAFLRLARPKSDGNLVILEKRKQSKIVSWEIWIFTTSCPLDIISNLTKPELKFP